MSSAINWNVFHRLNLVLRSRCRILRSCMYCTASSSWMIHSMTWASAMRLPFFLCSWIFWSRSPPYSERRSYFYRINEWGWIQNGDLAKFGDDAEEIAVDETVVKFYNSWMVKISQQTRLVHCVYGFIWSKIANWNLLQNLAKKRKVLNQFISLALNMFKFL